MSTLVGIEPRTISMDETFSSYDQRHSESILSRIFGRLSRVFQFKVVSFSRCNLYWNSFVILIFFLFQRFTQYLASSNSSFQLSNFLDKGGVQG